MKRVTLLFAACIAATASVAHAEFPDGTFTIQLENDLISSADRHYTHGSRLSWVSDKSTDGPLWIRDALEWMYPLAKLRAGRMGFALGQNLYTPEDVEATALIRNDRPYAGWLYAGASVHAEAKRTDLGIEFDTLDTIEVDLGVVGPYALGEETQNTIHSLFGVDESNGWDNQLKNEPGIMMVFERKWRPEPWRPALLQPAHLELDLVPHFGGSLGNVMTMAHAGATVRMGRALHADYGPPMIRPALSGLAALEEIPDFGWYVFAAGDVRLVGHDIFLDGNTFTDSHSVDKNIVVADLQLGISAYYHNIRLSLIHVFRTREFEEQRRGDRYGAISLSARF